MHPPDEHVQAPAPRTMEPHQAMTYIMTNAYSKVVTRTEGEYRDFVYELITNLMHYE